MTSFHHSQFDCSIWMEVGQILGHTFFQMCPKFMTPHLFDCKNITEQNMTPTQKWCDMTWEILGKILI